MSGLLKRPYRVGILQKHRSERTVCYLFGDCALRLYVGNLNFDTTEDSLRDHFSAHGTVDEVAIITDRETGRPRGFAFVTMASEDDGRKAIEELGGKELEGRTLNVNQARERQSGGPRRERY